MKTRLDLLPFPVSFAGHPSAKGLIAETLIAPTKASKLRMAVLVFDTRKRMQAFIERGLNQPGQYGTDAMMYRTFNVVETVHAGDGPSTFLANVHPRLFGIMLLHKDGLTMRILTHECAHAGLAYHMRITGQYMDPHTIKDLEDEETICYAAGDIAGKLVTFLNRKGLAK